MTLLDSNTLIYLSKGLLDIRKQYPIKLPDAIICATAIQQNAVLYTNDIGLKSINGLNL